MIEKILITATWVCLVCLVLIIFLVVREAIKNEKKRIQFATTMKVGDKCKVHTSTGSHDVTISKIDGEIVTVEIRCHKDHLYPLNEEKI